LDPFGGDGRLVAWLLEAWHELSLPPRSWRLQLWDLTDAGFHVARERVNALRNLGIQVRCDFVMGDAFRHGATHTTSFDIVITNPPWENLKPDRREIEQLDDEVRDAYVSSMRCYDKWLSEHFPRSQPRRKFAGWGTNLSRVGLELSLLLTRPTGVVGAVMPASLLADDQSVELRRYLLTGHALRDVAYYPAEAKLYGSADIASITIVAEAHRKPSRTVPITTHRLCGAQAETAEVNLDPESLFESDFVLPVAFGSGATRLLSALSASHPTWGALEADPASGFWAGREVDETGSAHWLVPLSTDTVPFLKGRMIDRYQVKDIPTHGVAKPGWHPPLSVQYERIAWRDVSRSNQKRRIISTLVPSGWALGNSLGVAYFASGRREVLKALLGVMNSTTFEFQLRARLATGHISLSSLRKMPLPSIDALEADRDLQTLVEAALDGDANADVIADAHVALHLYGLTLSDYGVVLDMFPKLDDEDKLARRVAFEKLN
jgi:Alw26I/Eco31I/Esp3I family type II restriction m6 adenine DNA methyltransferase